jgi:hypothetical protein
MAGLGADRNTPQDGAYPVPTLTNYPVAASTHIFKGSLVCIDSSGNLVPGDQTASVICVGMADANVDNSSGAAAALSCPVIQGVFRWDNGNTITKSSVGALLWVVDDHTVSSSSAGATAPAGTCFAVDSVGVWVQSMLAAVLNGTSLTTFESNLASTTTSQGATLVGINDAGSVITATNVETALQEVAKEARAALGDFSGIPVLALTALSSTGVIAGTLVTGVSGKIGKLDASVLTPVTTTGKAVTLTVQINATTVGGGALVLNSTNCATLGSRIAGATVTSANSFGPTDSITIQCSGVTAFVEGAVLLQLFLASA